MNQLVYTLSRWLGMSVAFLVVRLHRLGCERVPLGPYLLVCNHISHFDPPLLSVAIPQTIEFMSMVELFQYRIFAHWLHLVGCFPVHREAHDPRAVRTTIRRLRAGRIVGFFPEGGIRLGSESILGGARLSRSAAVLAHLGRAPVRTCLIIGSDQLYDWRSLFRRPEVYLLFGEEFNLDPSLPKKAAREQLTTEIEASFHRMYHRLEAEGKITHHLRSRTAQERWGGGEEVRGS